MNFISTNFVFDGISSEDMGIYLIKTNSGMIDSEFMAEREIISEQINGNQTPYIYSDKFRPFRYKMQLSPLEGIWTNELKGKVSRWLNNGKFNEFYTYDDIDRRYFITYMGSPQLNITGNLQGWIDIEFLNLDCYIRSNVYEKIYDLSAINSPTVITFENLGDNPLLPELWIEKVTDGDLSIQNLSDGGKTLTITGLFNNETVFIDNKERQIRSNLPNRHLFDACNKNYLKFGYGINSLQVSSKCKLKFRYRFEYNA